MRGSLPVVSGVLLLGGNLGWSNTCGPDQLRAQVDFAIFVR